MRLDGLRVRAKHKGRWEDAALLKTSAQVTPMAPLLLDHLGQLSGQAPVSRMRRSTGRTGRPGKETEVVSQWYNLHASWGQNVAALAIEEDTEAQIGWVPGARSQGSLVEEPRCDPKGSDFGRLNHSPDASSGSAHICELPVPSCLNCQQALIKTILVDDSNMAVIKLCKMVLWISSRNNSLNWCQL